MKRPTGPNAPPTAPPSTGAPVRPKKPKRRNNQPSVKELRRRQEQRNAGVVDPAAEAATFDDTQMNMIAGDHRKYYKSLVEPQFSGMSTNPYWSEYLDQAYANADQGYYNANLMNNNLHYANYMQSLGAGGGTGQLGPLGTGQAGQVGMPGGPVDTGNPFTSSSGLGAQAAVASASTLGKRPNAQQHPNQLTRWKKAKKKQGQVGGDPATLGEAGINPMAAGTGYTDELRRGFLALSPLERGDVALGKTAVPGRWSPWG